jgi:hypothetical protein
VAGAASYSQAVNTNCNEAWGGQRLRARARTTTQIACVFVLADGRQFSCPSSFMHTVVTASQLESSTSCRSVAPLHLSESVRRVTRVTESTQACLLSHKVRTIGNGVLPPLAVTNGPDGELIAGFLPNGALIAFYRTVEKAERLEPAVLRNARREHAQVERVGAVTVFWVRPPSRALRAAVQACLPGTSR